MPVEGGDRQEHRTDVYIEISAQDRANLAAAAVVVVVVVMPLREAHYSEGAYSGAGARARDFNNILISIEMTQETRAA